MALAVLELEALERGRAEFKIDTGTNDYYTLKFGRSITERAGVAWLDDVFFATPVAQRPAPGALFDTSMTVSVPLARLDRNNVYVQLFSYKDRRGKSPGFSSPLPLFPKVGAVDLRPDELTMAMTYDQPELRKPRQIECTTYAQTYAQSASLEDLLSSVLKAAAPVVLKLLNDGQANNAASNNSGAKPGSSQPQGADGILASLLKAVMGAVSGGGLAGTQSLLGNPNGTNRFFADTAYVRPFIFGIDDALIGALAGPIIQVLPQLLNSANQKRIQLKQADNKLITDLVSDTNRRLLLQQLLQAQQDKSTQAPTAQNPDLNALIQLLQQVPDAGTAQPAAVQPAAKAASMSYVMAADTSAAPEVSSKAVLTFDTADPVQYNGQPQHLFSKSQPVQFNVRLNVVAPAPKSPLPKAILKVVLKDGDDQTEYAQKTLKTKDVAANAVMSVAFSADELARVPMHRRISVLAELRWRTSAQNERKAYGSMDIIVVRKYFVKEQGQAGTREVELTDMQRFRPFWNKVWQSPVLDATNNRGDSKKYLWELDVMGKYTVLLSPTETSNGLMQTKILRGPPDPDSVTERVDGRLKAGIEISMAELNKLMPLWDGAAALDAEKLEAICTPFTAQRNGTEVTYNFKLKGRAAERGLFWVVPVLKQCEFTLGVVAGVDAAGQVTRVDTETVQFPLPVAVRMLGLKSEQ